jgi:DNA-binding response OmpR family regulator
VLDLMLPGASGLDVCRELRRESAVPVIMLTFEKAAPYRIVDMNVEVNQQ